MTPLPGPASSLESVRLPPDVHGALFGLAAVTHWIDMEMLAERSNVSARAVAAALLPNVDTERGSDGSARWVLRSAVRRRTLAGANQQQVRYWIERAAGAEPSEVQRLLQDWLLGELAAKPRDGAEQATLQRVAGWLRDCTWVVPAAREVLRSLSTLELRRQLERAASANFVGRRRELAELSQGLQGPGGIALVEARGGMGKSALLARLFLERGAFSVNGPIVMVLDFDDASVSPHDLASLLGELARQAALQDTRLDGMNEAFREHAAQGRHLETSHQRDLEGSRILSLFHALFDQIRATGRPASIVLDTLERASHLDPRALDQLVVILRRAQESYPGLSLVLAGRGPFELPSIHGEKRLELGPLAPEEAREMLAQLSVAPTMAERLLKLVTPTPLTLRLAARVAARLGAAGLDADELHLAIQKARVDGYLHSRVLMHLPSRRLARVAQLSLPLLAVTPDRLRRVIGPLLDPVIRDAAEAEAMFASFSKLSDLVAVPHAGQRLVLRFEVQQELLELAREEDPAQVLRVHARAAEVLEGETSLGDVTERAYHLLALGRENELELTPRLEASLSALLPLLPAAASRGLLRPPLDFRAPGSDFTRSADRRNAWEPRHGWEPPNVFSPYPDPIVPRVATVLSQPSTVASNQELQDLLVTHQEWSKLAAADKSLLRRAATRLGTAESLRAAAEAAGFEWTGRLDFRKLAAALVPFPQLNATLRLEGDEAAVAQGLDAIHQAGSLNSLALLALSETDNAPGVVEALVHLLHQMGDTEPPILGAEDPAQRAQLIGRLASAVSHSFTKNEWTEWLHGVAPRVAEKWAWSGDDDTAVHHALVELDRRQLGGQLQVALHQRGLTDEAGIANEVFGADPEPEE